MTCFDSSGHSFGNKRRRYTDLSGHKPANPPQRRCGQRLGGVEQRLGADGQCPWRHSSIWLAIVGQLKWRCRASTRFFARTSSGAPALCGDLKAGAIQLRAIFLIAKQAPLDQALRGRDDGDIPRTRPPAILIWALLPLTRSQATDRPTVVPIGDSGADDSTLSPQSSHFTLNYSVYESLAEWNCCRVRYGTFAYRLGFGHDCNEVGSSS